LTSEIAPWQFGHHADEAPGPQRYHAAEAGLILSRPPLDSSRLEGPLSWVVAPARRGPV